MKKLIIIIPVFLFILFGTNLKNVMAESEGKTFTQGFYKFNDTGLVTGSSYKIRNSSSSKAVVIVFDSNQAMQEFIRLEPNSPQYILKPLEFGSVIIIVGGGSIVFS